MKGIVKTHIIDDLYSYSISYKADTTCGPVTGMELTGGRPVEINGKQVVSFENKFKGQTICIGYESRPELAALVVEYKAIEAQKQADREARWATEKSKQDAIDKPLLDAMQAEAAALRASVPTDHVLVDVNQTGDLDGHPILEYTVDGIKLNWQDVKVVGVASAERPGALGSFAIERICSISKTRLETIKINQQTVAETSRIIKEAGEKDLKETEIPQGAIEAYRQYHGDEEKAWEDGNETAWAMIGKWTPYIEEQHGIDPQKLQREVSEAAREASFGINEG